MQLQWSSRVKSNAHAQLFLNSWIVYKQLFTRTRHAPAFQMTTVDAVERLELNKEEKKKEKVPLIFSKRNVFRLRHRTLNSTTSPSSKVYP